MNWMRVASALFAAVFLHAGASDFSGAWKAVFTGPLGERPKMVSEMVFHFNVDGDDVTGDAHMADWPGDAPIAGGKIDGDRITFTVIGKSPWRASTPVTTTSGYPKLVFHGLLKDGAIAIKLNWGSILTTGEERSGDQDLDMRATRMP